MPVGINEMLESLNAAIRDTSWLVPEAPALQLRGRREVLGEYGVLVAGAAAPDDLEVAAAAPVTHPRQTFSFTRAQCKRMRKTIRKAARADLKQR